MFDYELSIDDDSCTNSNLADDGNEVTGTGARAAPVVRERAEVAVITDADRNIFRPERCTPQRREGHPLPPEVRGVVTRPHEALFDIPDPRNRRREPSNLRHPREWS